MSKDKDHIIDKLTGHYESVKLQHDELGLYIEEQYKNYASDDKIQELKIHKLHLKEEMQYVLSRIEALENES